MSTILVADDDREIREIVCVLLENEGYTVLEATNGGEAVEKAVEGVDLILLDVMMPGRSGFSACAEIRKRTTVPILFLTAKTQDSDKALGFSAGGDDYLAKPFSCAELTLRVKALLRRCQVYDGKVPDDSRGTIRVQNVTIDLEKSEVRKDGEEVLLTNLEYRILLLLARHRRKIFTAQNIYESVWDEPYFFTANNTVMVHIRNLRRKLEDDPQRPKIILNVWGKGYRIE